MGLDDVAAGPLDWSRRSWGVAVVGIFLPIGTLRGGGWFYMMLKPLVASAFVDSWPSLSIATKRGVRLWFFLGDESPLPCVRFIVVWILGSVCPSTSEAASRMKFLCTLVKGF